MAESEDQERDRVWMELYKTHKIDEDVKFDDICLSDKLKTHPFIKIQYEENYYKEKAKLERMIQFFEKYRGERYEFYRFNCDKTLTNKEIENYYLPKDASLLTIQKRIRKQKWRVDFFEMCVKALNDMGWRMKEFVETLKFER